MSTAEPEDGPGRWRPVLAWAGVVGWGTWAVVRLAGGDRVPGIGVFAAPLLVLTPFVAAATPIPIGIALLLRRWWAAAAAGAVALALVAPLVPRVIGGGQPAAQGPVIRVLSSNTFFGEADADELVDLVRRTKADVLSFQELRPEAVRRYERAGLTRLLPHSVVDARWGAAGSGLYSRFPLQELPQPVGMAFATPQAELVVSGHRVQVTAVHPVPPIAAESYEAWKRDLRALPSASGESGPVRILAGDFNASLDHGVLRGLLGRGYADAADRTGSGLVPTWGVGGGRPPITLDHVLVDKRCAVTRFAAYDVTGSDHRAILAEIRLP